MAAPPLPRSKWANLGIDMTGEPVLPYPAEPDDNAEEPDAAPSDG